MLPLNQVLLGDCVERLKELPDESLDAAVLDPPYGLGTREPTVDEIIAYLQGAELNTSGDFMGVNWSVPSVAVWREVYRVLKPGAHVVSFAGTRTWDLIVLGLRAAGFEFRDTIASNFGVMALQWVQGQGMPKSANLKPAFTNMGLPEAAEKWAGWGTATKPSWEPAIVARKPIAEKTVAKQVLKTGTGAINIDACRVNPGDTVPGGGNGKANHGGNFGGAGEQRGTRPIVTPHNKGRWPPNTAWIHAEGCRRTGSKKVDAPVINRFTDGAKPFGNGAGHEYTSEQQGDAEGKEEITIYECQEGCPVRALDEQSGERRSSQGGGNQTEVKGGCGIGFNGQEAGGYQSTPYCDAGGSSRYFPQFEQEPYDCVDGCPVKTLDDQSGVLKTSGGPLNRSGIGFQGGSDGNQDYIPPSEGGASRFFPQFEQESFECVEGCPVKVLGEQSGVQVSGTAYEPDPKQMNRSIYGATNTLGCTVGFGDVGTAARYFPQFEQLEAPFMYCGKVSKRERDEGLPKGTNNHPCLKPVALMRWLVRLVTPKNHDGQPGIVLDPYAGSGSTLVAAIKEGFNFIGIERDPEFHRIATMRVEAAQPPRDIFDDMDDL